MIATLVRPFPDNAVALGVVDDRDVVAWADHGLVQCAAIDTGVRVGKEVDYLDTSVLTVDVTTWDGSPKIVVGGGGSLVGVIDLSTSTEVTDFGFPRDGDRLLCGWEDSITALAVGERNGSAFAFCGCRNGALRVCDLQAQEWEGGEAPHRSVVFAVCLRCDAGRRIMVSTGWDGVVNVFLDELATPQVQIEPGTTFVPLRSRRACSPLGATVVVFGRATAPIRSERLSAVGGCPVLSLPGEASRVGEALDTP